MATAATGPSFRRTGGGARRRGVTEDRGTVTDARPRPTRREPRYARPSPFRAGDARPSRHAPARRVVVAPPTAPVAVSRHVVAPRTDFDGVRPTGRPPGAVVAPSTIATRAPEAAPGTYGAHRATDAADIAGAPGRGVARPGRATAEPRPPRRPVRGAAVISADEDALTRPGPDGVVRG